MKDIITVKTKKGETSLEDFCSMESKRILLLMKSIEEEFGVNLREHKPLRKEFLNVSEFIKNIPDMICEVYNVGFKNELDD